MQPKSNPYRTIKSLVFDYIHHRNGQVNYEALTKEVLEHFPGSKWKIKNIGPKNESFLVTNSEDYLAISDHLAEKIRVTIVRD